MDLATIKASIESSVVQPEKKSVKSLIKKISNLTNGINWVFKKINVFGGGKSIEIGLDKSASPMAYSPLSSQVESNIFNHSK